MNLRITFYSYGRISTRRTVLKKCSEACLFGRVFKVILAFVWLHESRKNERRFKICRKPVKNKANKCNIVGYAREKNDPAFQLHKM